MNASSSAGKLSAGDLGSFGELEARSNPDGLYVPGLAALLERASQLKGSELSDAETARIAEHANAWPWRRKWRRGPSKTEATSSSDRARRICEEAAVML